MSSPTARLAAGRRRMGALVAACIAAAVPASPTTATAAPAVPAGHSGPRPGAGGSADKRVPPRNLQDYADALKWSAARWKSVQAWEVWNEPNAAEFLNPADPAAYTRLLKASYPAVKAGNPAAKVVFAGT